MTEIVRKESFHSKGWHAIIAMLMVVGGSACFVLSCISATRAGGIFLHKKEPPQKNRGSSWRKRNRLYRKPAAK